MSSVMLSKPLRNSWTLCALVAFLHAVHLALRGGAARGHAARALLRDGSRAIAGAQLTVGAGDGCGVAVRRVVGEEGG